MVLRGLATKKDRGTVLCLVNSICGCDSVTEFQKFTEIKKEISIRKMYKKGLSIRQIVRLTGTSKGLVEKWLK